MPTAGSFSYSHSPGALTAALEMLHTPLLLMEPRSRYEVARGEPQPAPPVSADICFPPGTDVLQLYFDDAIRRGHPSLLSREEEIELAQIMDKGRRADARLKSPRPANGRTQALQEAVQSGQAARDRLITANLRLVVSVATWYRTSSIPLEDLIQEGNIGLMQAADRFDWRRGNRFSTYAVWWIRQAISRSLANHSRLIRVPVHAHQRLAQIARSQRRIHQQTGCQPAPEDIAADAGLPVKTVQQLVNHLSPPASLEEPIESTSGSSTPLSAFVGDPDGTSLEEHAGRTMAYKALQEALESLSPREQHLLTRRYGLNGSEGLSLRAAGEALGISKGQAQVLETNALAKLRHHDGITSCQDPSAS